MIKPLISSVVLLLCFSSFNHDAQQQSPKKPNILFVIADDQSWVHTSIAGDKVVNQKKKVLTYDSEDETDGETLGSDDSDTRYTSSKKRKY